MPRVRLPGTDELVRNGRVTRINIWPLPQQRLRLAGRDKMPSPPPARARPPGDYADQGRGSSAVPARPQNKFRGTSDEEEEIAAVLAAESECDKNAKVERNKASINARARSRPPP